MNGIDYSEVFKGMRTAILTRLGSRQMPVLQMRSLSYKPNKLFATLDIVGVWDTNARLQAVEYDVVRQIKYYVTHKDIRVRIGVRNGNPEDTTAQMDVLTVLNNLHKGFREDKMKMLVFDELGAVIKGIDRTRLSNDYVDTGIGSTGFFDVIIGMPDITSEEIDVFESVEIGGTIYEDRDITGKVNINAGYEGCNGLQWASGLGSLKPISMGVSNIAFLGSGKVTLGGITAPLQFKNPYYFEIWGGGLTEPTDFFKIRFTFKGVSFIIDVRGSVLKVNENTYTIKENDVMGFLVDSDKVAITLVKAEVGILGALSFKAELLEEIEVPQGLPTSIQFEKTQNPYLRMVMHHSDVRIQEHGTPVYDVCGVGII